MQPQAQIEQLLAFCTDDRDDIVQAKTDYFALTGGEVHQEDRSFEHRMQGFFNFYLFDRKSAEGLTPVQRYLEARGAQLGGPEKDLLEGATRSVHALFDFRGRTALLRRVKPGCVRVRDVFTGDDYDVLEQRPLHGIERGDLLEARLLPVSQGFWFSTSFVFHPRLARSTILREVKRRKKKVGALDPARFLSEISKMALQAERFKNVPLGAIYNFDTPFLGHKRAGAQGSVRHG
jgi:hypothetical protein